MKKAKVIKSRLLMISFLLLLGMARITGYGQTTFERHTPYPIIFVHGLNGNSDSWYGKQGSYNNVIDYLVGGDNSLQDGGRLKITLDHDRSLTTLSNTKIEDVYLFDNEPKPADFYAINFNVHSNGSIAKRSNTTYSDPIISPTAEQIMVVEPIFYVGDIICIDNEFMNVEGVAGSGLIIKVKRGILNTIANTHFYVKTVWNLSNESNQASIVKQGYGLKLAIDAVLNANKDIKKVILVGHSMGGLAIREYLRTYYNDDVAKVVTIGTPHLGSNISELSNIVDVFEGIDTRSDAIRDLEYNYSDIDGDPNPPYGNSPDNSIYLFGGDSESFLASETNFYNPDVNANGTIDLNCPTGLNTDILKSLPSSVSYSWIISQWGLVADGDGCVRLNRQFPWSEGSSLNIKSAIGNIIVTDKRHDQEINDYYSLLRGLDEPDDPSLAYIIGENSKNRGFITYVEDNDATDIDLYKLILKEDGALKINVSGNNYSSIVQFELLDENQNRIQRITGIIDPIEYNANAGTYFIRIRGTATSGQNASYKYPYTLNTSFVAKPPSAIAVSPGSLQYYDVVMNAPKEKIITLTNNGTTDILITSIALSGADKDQFTVSPMPPFAVTPDLSQNLHFTFNPTSTGAKEATLEITTNSPDIPTKTISLKGNGTDHETKVLLCNPTESYNYGNTKISTSRNKTFTLQNTGSNICTVSSLSIEGLNPDAYSIISTPTLPFDLATGETKQLTVKFSPTSIGVKNASLVISNNSDNLSPTYSIGLYGNGTENPYSGNSVNIAAYEYWFDDQYNTKVTATVNSESVAQLEANLPTDGLINGLHSLHIRYKDTKGKWSSVVSEFFHKMPWITAGPRNITASEYWFDDAYSAKVETPVTPSQVITFSSSLNVSSLSNGLHSYHVRYKDDAGQWSSIVSEFFHKQPANTITPNLITTYRYWFDNNESGMISVTLPGPTNPYFLIKDLNTNGLILGDHSVHFQFRDSNHLWSSVVSEIITVTNTAPVANAGIDQSVYEGAIVGLDGSSSSDPDGKPLTYLWNSPAEITLSSTTVAKPTFTAPNVTGDKNYQIALVVNNGSVGSNEDQVIVTVKHVNKMPFANAGADQVVNKGAIVTLDATTSSDPDGNPLTYKWTAPLGITLNSTTIAKPTFSAPEVNINTDYTFSLVVNDGTIDSPADQVVITVKNVNKVPMSNAGVDQSVNEGTIVTLDATASSDPDGNPLTYKWTAPLGITLNSTTIAKPTFTAPDVNVNTNYTLSLVVNDGAMDSPADQVVITVKHVNKSPIANAGPDQSVYEGATVTLDGSASSDPEGNPITYKWSASTGIMLSSTTDAKPTFTAPEVTANKDFTISLVVNDGAVDSPADQVLITVKNINKVPTSYAGIDQSVNEGAIVSLDGSSSTDADGNTLTYKWSAPAEIILSSTTDARPTFKAPEVTANKDFTISLVVNDGIVDSPADQVVITVKNVNNVPMSNAGIDQSVNEGSIVTLDGSASSDADGSPLTYKWSAPDEITLSSTTVAKPTFTAPEVTANKDFIISLIVNDGALDSPADQVVITVKNVNKVPMSNAGLDQSVNEGAIVSLDGSASTDADGNTLIYKWSAPSEIILNSTTVAKPTFTAPEVTTNKDFTISLVVNNGIVDSPVDQVVITVKNVNKVPMSNAGIDQSVNEGNIVTLDGSASSDADGNPLTYKWIAPAEITLSPTTVAKPTFTAPEVTANKDFIISLIVNDGAVDSPADQVVITVKNVDHPPYIKNVIPDLSVEKGAPVQLIDLKTVFADDDLSDVLSYVVTSNSNTQVISAAITNSTLTLSFSTANTGTSEIVITASSNAKDVQSKFKVEVKLSTGVDALIDEEEVQIYPNPTTGIVYLKFKKMPEIGTSITVFDLSGKTIKESKADKKEVHLNLSGNSPGIYIIQIDRNTPKIFKIILK